MRRSFSIASKTFFSFMREKKNIFFGLVHIQMKNWTLRQNWSKTNQNMRKEKERGSENVIFSLKSATGKIGRENFFFCAWKQNGKLGNENLVFLRSEYPNRNTPYWIETKCKSMPLFGHFHFLQKICIEKQVTNIPIVFASKSDTHAKHSKQISFRFVSLWRENSTLI